uniref:Uncharacterized protein n=1 Tax=Vespula pensylvanica TaxID=30213 RepID=A0A834JQF3_VESPE|nr:hypothetical protein H0235_018125 [Vespula pensylvanica]
MILPRTDINVLAVNAEQFLLSPFCLSLTEPWIKAGLLWLQGGQKTDDKNTNESEGVQKTENAPEQSEQMEQMEETQPSSEQAQS